MSSTCTSVRAHAPELWSSSRTQTAATKVEQRRLVDGEGGVEVISDVKTYSWIC